MADFLKMLQQAQQVTGKIQEVQNELAALTVYGASGGGMVRVEADGKGAVKRISIDPAAVTPADVEMLEDLVTVAVQDAQKKARELSEAEMQKAAGTMGLGGLPFKLPF